VFPEALTALAAFAHEATGRPARIGAPIAGDGAAPQALTDASGTSASGDEPGAVTIHLVSVTRTERFQGANREIGHDPSGTGLSVRPGPGWFDLTVALEAGGEEIAAAEALERILSAGIRVGDLAKAMGLDSQYPVYALIDTPTAEELHAWWRHGVIQVPRAALKATVTVAVQPFELAPVGIVRSRRLHTDDMRTRVRETVER
jgi:hypothetical protein